MTDIWTDYVTLLRINGKAREKGLELSISEEPCIQLFSEGLILYEAKTLSQIEGFVDGYGQKSVFSNGLPKRMAHV